MNILILGGGLQGLSCAESLYKSHKVFCVCRDLMSSHSHLYTKIFDSSYAQGEKLYQLLKDEHIDVLIPVSDMNVPYISQNKEDIETKTGTKCAVPSYQNVFQVEDKSRFMSFCQANDIPHPKTSKIDSTSIEQAVEYVGFPALIKPDYSVGARGITRVNNIDELKMKLPDVVSTFGTCTLQEFIDNKEYYYNVMLYRDKNRRFLAHAIIKIVRMYPVNAGSSSCCISVENDELLGICKDCLDKLNWVGMADFDVLQRLDNKEYKIIEINARVPASLRGASISGVNFPEILVNDAMDIPVPEYNYSPGKTLRYMGIDIMWLLKSPRRLYSNPCWLKFFGKDIYYMDILKSDPSTWWTWLAEGISKLGRRNKKLR